jgi:hypothetical protein
MLLLLGLLLLTLAALLLAALSGVLCLLVGLFVALLLAALLLAALILICHIVSPSPSLKWGRFDSAPFNKAEFPTIRRLTSIVCAKAHDRMVKGTSRQATKKSRAVRSRRKCKIDCDRCD